ncbi:MAG: tetratricopeptide repeat protein [Gemmatimonadales bacterium]
MIGSLQHLHARRVQLLAEIEAEPTGEERARLRAEIITLFHDASAELLEVTAFRESIRELIARFKEIPTAVASSVRHDHIGASTHIERGWSELASAEWSEAESQFRRAIAADSTSATARALLAWALVGQGRGDDATDACHIILKRDPSNPLASVALGVARLQAGDHEVALAHLSVALAGGEPRATLYGHYWTAVVLLRCERFADAVTHAERAVRLGPNLGEGWAVLGEAHWHLGDPERAGQAWRTGAKARHSPHAIRCIELLENMAATGVPPRPSRP